MRLRSAFTICLILLGTRVPVAAQLTDSTKQSLLGDIGRAVQSLDAERFPDLAESKTNVLNRIEQANDHFRRRTDPANAAAWMAYLDVEPLRQAIESDVSAQEIGRTARELRFRLLATAPGLEMDVLQDLRTAVEYLINAVLFRDRERSIQQIEKQLDGLAKLIEGMENQPSPTQGISLSALVRVIAASGQAPDLILSLQRAFNQPNLAVTLGEDLVEQAVQQDVEETGPVNDCILGTRLIGQARLRGNVTADLVPSVNDARVKVTLVGSVYTNSRGYNGPVRLRTLGDGNITASRMVTISESGVRLGQTRVEKASLFTKIKAIEHPLRIVRNIARKQAANKKSQADRIALRKMGENVSDQFAQQTDEAITVDLPELVRARKILQRLSLPEPLARWSSSNTDLQLQASFRRDDQLTTVTPRPSIDGAYQILMQVHESALDNAVSPVLSGRTVKEGQLIDLFGLPDKDSDAANENAGNEKPFEIDFARLRPVIFEAREGSLRLGIRGTRFKQGGRELKQPLEITAIYRPTESNGVVTLVRDGDVSIDFPGGRPLTISQAGMRRSMQKKFTEVFPASVLGDPLEVPGDAKLKSLRGQVFQPTLIAAKDGWLTIGVQ
ncbi:MAG: hypothetical protein AAGG48_05675 [Planctomycetota bacterium]